MTPEKLLDLRKTIEPKSDQLNFDDVAYGPMVVKVRAVKGTGNDKQPVAIYIEGDERPYKPCKTMRRVLVAAWGEKPGPYIGRSMELFGNPEVKYGGIAVGGIQIGKLSHIEKPLDLIITMGRGRRANHHVDVLLVTGKPPVETDGPAVKFREWLKGKGISEDDAVRCIDGTPIDKATDADWKRLREWAKTAEPKPASPWEGDDAAFEAARAAKQQGADQGAFLDQKGPDYQ